MFDNEEYWTRTNSGGFDTPSASRLFKCYCDGLSPYTQGSDAHPLRQCTSSVGQLTCLGLKTFLSMYFRFGSPRTAFRTWFPFGVQQTPSDIFRTSLPGLEFRISFPFGRKEFNTLVSDFVIITSVLDLAPVLLSFGSRTQNLYRTSDSLPWLIKPWKGNLTHHVSDLVPEDHHTSFGTSHRILFPGVSTPFRTL